MLKWVWGAGAALLLAVHLFCANAINQLITTYALDGLTPITLFMDAILIPKLIMILCNLALISGTMVIIAGLVLALVRQDAGARTMEWIIGLAGGAAATFGALGGLYGYMITLQAIESTNTTNPAVIAPSHAESLLTVSIGAFAGFVLLTGAFLIALLRMWRKPKPAAA